MKPDQEKKIIDHLIDLHEGVADNTPEALLADETELGAQYLHVWQALRDMPASTPPETVTANFNTWLANQEASNDRHSRATSIPIRWAYGIAAAVAFLILAFTAILTLSSSEPQIAKALEHDSSRVSSSQKLSFVHEVSSKTDISAKAQKILTQLALEDPSAHVRLKALEALYTISSEMQIYETAITALETEKAPLVQLALLRILTEASGDQAKSVLADLAQDRSLYPTVRDQAQWALNKL